jgi:polysaccharide deacetylase 2 family uncharacterized protein YibQ
VRRQRQNRLRWQRQQQQRQRWRRAVAATAGLGGLLLLAVGAGGAAGTWLTEPQAAGDPPPLVVALADPMATPASPRPPAALPAPQLAVEPPPNGYEPPKAASAPMPPPEPEIIPLRRVSVPMTPPVLGITEVALAALPVPVPPPPAVVEPPRPPSDDEALPAWRRYAAAAPLGDGPMIAIIIDDMGLNVGRNRATIALPAPLTLSFLPYGVYAADLAMEARAAGHEVMLHLPMQPESDAENPGPKALRVDLGPAELSARLTWYLTHLPGYVGVNNHMGSRFTQSGNGMALVMQALRQRGLLFVDSVTSPHSVGLAMARRSGVPALARDIFLDNALDGRQIAGQLAAVEAVARRSGQAIAIGHPHPETVAALRLWLPTLAAKGFTLAPVTALLRRQQGS